MIRAFVALSLLVLGLMLYAIKGGRWNAQQSATIQTAAVTPQVEATQTESSSSSSSVSATLGEALSSTDSDDLGIAATQNFKKTNETAKASADLKQLQTSQEKAALQKQLAALSKKQKEDKELLDSTEKRLKKETSQAIESAKKAALADAAQQIEAKIAAVQSQANDKIEKTQTLLQALQREKQKLESKNDELEKIQQEAQAAADVATEAAKNAHMAVQKTAQILGSRKQYDSEEIITSLADASTTTGSKTLSAAASSTELIRSVDDAKRMASVKKSAGESAATSSKAASYKSTSKASANEQRQAKAGKNAETVADSSIKPAVGGENSSATQSAGASTLLKQSTASEKDPITGFPVTYGYSTFLNNKATILFSFASNALSPSAKEALTKCYAAFIKESSKKILVIGFSDGTGSKTAQEKISAARTESVREFLISLGAEASKIAVKTNPDTYVHDNSTAQGRMLNRRVEVSIL